MTETPNHCTASAYAKARLQNPQIAAELLKLAISDTKDTTVETLAASLSRPAALLGISDREAAGILASELDYLVAEDKAALSDLIFLRWEREDGEPAMRIAIDVMPWFDCCDYAWRGICWSSAIFSPNSCGLPYFDEADEDSPQEPVRFVTIVLNAPENLQGRKDTFGVRQTWSTGKDGEEEVTKYLRKCMATVIILDARDERSKESVAGKDRKLHRLLGILFRDELSDSERDRLLEAEFGIRPTAGNTLVTGPA